MLRGASPAANLVCAGPSHPPLVSAHQAACTAPPVLPVPQDARMFKRKKWKYLILDEAHMIKNWKSQRWQVRAGLSGM